MDPKKTLKSNWFLKRYSKKSREEIRQEYYKVMDRMGINLSLFVFFVRTY